MTNKREGWRKSPDRELQWSERQRHVLDLLVKGCTNGEIAERLGISLDGAKYHVREIVDRLGVDSRDEAAEWWRQQRGLRARLRVVTRFGSMAGAWRWAGSAAGLSAVVAIVLFVAVVTDPGAGDDSPIRVAVTLPVEVDDCPRDFCIAEVRQIHVMDGDGGNARLVGEPARWVALAWSPDGHRLAALSSDVVDGEPTATLALYVASDESLSFLPLPFFAGAMTWSPDGRSLYVEGMDRIAELSTTGTLLRESTVDKSGEFLLNPEPVHWSSDGRRMLKRLVGELAILDTADLSITEYDAEAHLAAPDPAWGDIETRVPYAYRWIADDVIEFAYLAYGPDVPDQAGWVGRLSLRSGAAWESEPRILAEDLLSGWYPEVFTEAYLRTWEPLEAEFPYENHTVACALPCLSADGGLRIGIVAHAPADAPSLDQRAGDRPSEWPEGSGLALAWVLNGDVQLIELSYEPRGPFATGGRLYDLHGIATSVVLVAN